MEASTNIHGLEAYDFELPPSCIAQHPAAQREDARLLFLQKGSQEIQDQKISDLPSLLRGDEIFVVNDTQVVPARLILEKETGGKVELLVLPRRKEDPPHMATCLSRTSRPLREGMALLLSTRQPACRVVETLPEGRVRVDFSACGGVIDALETHGAIPLPPYIEREGNPTEEDRIRYQTIFARNKGAIAAPTAGLHFTAKLVHTLEEKGIPVVPITLHVGPGTFAPIRTDDLRTMQVESERIRMGTQTAKALNEARKDGRKIIAVGTTAVRCLESVVNEEGQFEPIDVVTDLTIRPNHSFRAIDGLLTNFHLPKTTLLVLVSAFGGRERVLGAYKHAVANGYRFYSYGDAMLIR
jgi:S-adenosylmethionine:tRNA ribosyltransferase-isomerase